MKNKRYRLLTVITIVGILAVWFAVTNYGKTNPIFLPSPQKVGETFLAICKDGYKGFGLFEHIGSSLFRLLSAFILAIATAVPLGLCSGYVSWIRAIIEPVINFYRPLPPLAYYTLLVLWLGIGNESKILLLYLACFAPIYIACSSAVMKIEANYINNARMLGAKKHQVFFTVVFPFVLPDLFVGMRTSLGVGYTTLVAAEMVAAKSGIGWMVLDASNYLRSDIIFVGILIMGITGIAMDGIVRLVEHICVPWKGKEK